MLVSQSGANGGGTVLVVEDEPGNRAMLKRRLARAGYRVLVAQNGRQAVEVARAEIPDLVLLDIMLPIMNGFETLRELKETETTRHIPVIFLSARDEADDKVNGLALGANDYIGKPFDTGELLARIEVAMRLKRDRDQLIATAEEARINAEQAQERAMTDALTGLLNRFGLQRVLAREHAEARRYARPLSCLMIDVDNFKTINDSFGHNAGDEALQQIAAILTDAVRRSDMVCRFGGEEFLVLLPETDLEGAHALAEKIRETAAERVFGFRDATFSLTVSVGVTTLCHDESGNDMTARADVCLYHAKERGRNRVEVVSCT